MTSKVMLLFLGWMLLASGCAPSVQRDPPASVSGAVVKVRLSEYAFDYQAPKSSGRVIFQVENVGSTEHDLSFDLLPADLPPLDDQLRGTVRRVITPFAGIARIKPGQKTAFAVDLSQDQRYGLICYVRDSDGVVHYLKGMNSEFRIGT